MMLYEEESKGSIAREDIYKVDRVVSRDLSRARRRAQRDCLQEALEPGWHVGRTYQAREARV